jgi:hypothetical protein
VAPPTSAPVPPSPPPVQPKPVAFQPERPPAPVSTTPSPSARAGQPWYVWLIGAVIVLILLFWLL